MDISSLQVPKTGGRSRFSKALPTPPEFEGQTQTTLRELPDAPPAPPPPPMKNPNATVIKSKSTTSLRSKGFDSPLPPLPIMAEPQRPRALAGPIARKPVAQLPTPPASVGTKKTKAIKRQSSISSLLSAYSRSSSDWAQRSSHESDFTKESEPSYSPEREGVNSLPPIPSKDSLEIPNDATSDRASEITSYTIIDHFPPPPPLKHPARPRTPPSTVRPSDGLKDGEGGSRSLSPSQLSSGSPQAGREIWRRRASSKSDASLVIAELKLPGSNGSTASTSHPPPKKAEPPSQLPLPPLPAKPDPQRALPPSPKQHQQESSTTLPPRSTSLPGRNIRPVKQVEPLEQDDDEMGKLRKFSKLKGLLRRDKGEDDGGDEQKESEKPLQRTSVEKSAQSEHREMQNPQDLKGKPEADKPEPPAKDGIAQQRVQVDVRAAAVGAGASVSPATSDAPAPPPNDLGKASGTVIPRRAVNTTPARNPSQPEPQRQLGKENTTTPNAQSHPAWTPGGGLQPIIEAGSLPHPRHRQQRNNPPPSAYAHPRPTHGYGNGPKPYGSPTSPTGATPRSVSTPAGPALPMAASNRAPGATGSPRSQPASSPTSLGNLGLDLDKLSLQELIDSSPGSPVVGLKSPFLTKPPAPSNERVTAAPARESDAGAFGATEAVEKPMSDAAAAAIALFPRKQEWKVKCTVDGVYQPNPLGDRHYNCLANHSKLLNSPNVNYPLACQTCGIADAEKRFTCSFCNVRICQSCAAILVANGRDLKITMAVLKAKGAMHDWDKYPKQGDDHQNT
ncbi:hypothetical protein F4678DRAFT_70664 [Xylaria arbuscula]|nr:hypothetical protein F4678DRAFT_70664 [Xylaria arbuscula]